MLVLVEIVVLYYKVRRFPNIEEGVMDAIVFSVDAACEALSRVQLPVLLVPAGLAGERNYDWLVTGEDELKKVFEDVVAESYSGGVVMLSRSGWNIGAAGV